LLLCVTHNHNHNHNHNRNTHSMRIAGSVLCLFLSGQYHDNAYAYVNFHSRPVLSLSANHHNNQHRNHQHQHQHQHQPQHRYRAVACDDKFGAFFRNREQTPQSIIGLSSSIESNNNSNNSNDDDEGEMIQTAVQETQEAQQKLPSQNLSDMEDLVELKLDQEQQAQQAAAQQQLTLDDDPNLSLHADRAPTTIASSTDHMSTHEESFQNEDRVNAQRQRKIRDILEKDDVEYRDQRRKERFGKFADAKNAEDWKRLANEESERIKQENLQKTQIAQKSGVSFTLLENTVDSWDDSSTPAAPEKERSYTIEGSNKNTVPSWLNEIDADLNNEIKRANLSSSSSSSASSSTDETPRFVDGKLVVNRKDTAMGIRVGSAGGWSLEVFPGDFVVHRKFGIGRYDRTAIVTKGKLSEAELAAQEEARGAIVRSLVADGRTKEEIQEVVRGFGTDDDRDPVSNPKQTVLEVAYGDAKVRIPVAKAYRLSRFRAGDAAVKPRLSRVKGEAWAKAKRKVELETVEMAQEVLALYAKRETFARPPFDPTKEVYVRDFETTFPYEPTKDQKMCFEEVENDMVWRNRPMDRLVCGDVGFGKTEVALRALFRCVANGRQAALLAPTGVLASQHMKNVLQRMGPESRFKFRVALLRGGMGKNTKVGKAVRAEIASGGVDLVVGTHALLGSDLDFKNLGLLVVDEEQRFGVKQKERLKLIFDGIDVLTLSATPIPRTLQMSLSGIRDTSTIRSPPPMRKPVVTYVQEFDKKFIYEGIRRELDRGGQSFYVVPRINQLDEAERVIQELFPSVRIIQAHGRMSRGGAENNVAAFAEGNYDVLLATTVIENGVDIPSVNTIIIQNAQSFGMATLYQLRGRVGRSSLQAYAYFLHKKEAISEQSAMRLQAMSDLNELGAGFDVANRDLEIRGAGSLLGTEQSGMAAKVGFDLYMRMLKKSIRQLRGLDLPMVVRTNVLLPQGEGSLEIARDGGDDDGESHAFVIPKSFIEEDDERFKQEGIARLSENTNQLVALTEEWKKDYGPLPRVLQEKLKTLHLHACTRTLGIDLVAAQSTDDDGNFDAVLRCAGLRPRHYLKICQLLPKSIPTKGLDVIFPSRYTVNPDEGKDVHILGGTKIDASHLLLLDQTTAPNNNNNDQDLDDDWDAGDEEEVDTQNQNVQSATFVRALDEIRIDEYPRFLVRGLSGVDAGKRVDALLRVLLPASKVVYDRQQEDKEKAKVAAELKEKRQAMKKTKKEQELLVNRRAGYRY